MPTLIGIPSGKMIRTSVNSDTDDLGFSRLTESYAFASSELNTFHARFKNLTPYNTIMSFVHPLPTTTYPYVVIESVSITEDAGGISRAIIQYVGILKTSTASRGDISWLPPPKERLEPRLVDDIFPNKVSVILDFIYFSDSPTPSLDLIQKYGERTLLPASINGTNLLYRSVGPFRTELPQIFDPFAGFVRNPSTGGQPDTFDYFGMLCASHFSQRLGLFYKVTNKYQDSGVARFGEVFVIA